MPPSSPSYELNYCRNIGAIDKVIASRIYQTPSASDYFSGSKTLVLIGTKPNYVLNNALRVNNCTIGVWTLTGALEAQNSVNKLKLAYPVRNDAVVFLEKEIFDNSILLALTTTLISRR